MNSQNAVDVSALMSAAEAFKWDRVRESLQTGACSDLNQRNKNGVHLAHFLATSGNLELMETARKLNCDFRAIDKQGDTTIMWAAKHGHLSTVRYLHLGDIAIDAQNRTGETALHIAAREGHVDVVDYLASAMCANVNNQNHLGETALHYACWQRSNRVVAALCSKANVDLNVQTKQGQTPLIYAAARGAIDCVQLLIGRTILDVTDQKGWTALQYAIERHQTTIALMLINANCSIDHFDRNHDAPLHLACREQLLPVVQSLCAYGCRLDIHNSAGLTPLHIAVHKANIEIVRCLLLAGANPLLRSPRHLTAEELAVARNLPELAALIHKIKPERRSICVKQVVPTTRRLPCIKLKVFGHSLSGKSTLIQSLSASFFRTLLPRKASVDTAYKYMPSASGNEKSDCVTMRDRSLANSHTTAEPLHEAYTKGICIRNVHINSVGAFNCWEFSGFQSYFPYYDAFIGDTRCIHIIVYSLAKTPEMQREEVFFWLHFLKNRIPVRDPLGYCGRPRNCPHVIIIGTHADQVPTRTDEHTGMLLNDRAIDLLVQARERFRYVMEIHEQPFVLDARSAAKSGAETRLLRSLLEEWRTGLLSAVPNANGLYDEMCLQLDDWAAYLDIPVCTWQDFVTRVRNMVNPLASEEHLRELSQQLQCSGKIVYIESNSDDDLVVLQPKWLCEELLGNLMSYENLQNSNSNGILTLDDFHFMTNVSLVKASQLVNILQALEVCSKCDLRVSESSETPHSNTVKLKKCKNKREPNRQLSRVDDGIFYEFPALNLQEIDVTEMSIGILDDEKLRSLHSTAPALYGSSFRTETVTVCSGLQYRAPFRQLFHVLPRLQCRLRRYAGELRSEYREKAKKRPSSSTSDRAYRSSNSTLPSKSSTSSDSSSSVSEIASADYDLMSKHNNSVDLFNWQRGSKLTIEHDEVEAIHNYMFDFVITINDSCDVLEVRSFITYYTLPMNEKLINHVDGISQKCAEPKAKREQAMFLVLFPVHSDLLLLIERTFDEVCPNIEFDKFIVATKDMHRRTTEQRRTVDESSRGMLRLDNHEERPRSPKTAHSTSVFRHFLNRASRTKFDLALTAIEELSEDLKTALCFGNMMLFERLKLGIDLHMSSLRKPIIQRLCQLFDKKDTLGRDWCMLAVEFGLFDYLPKVDKANALLYSRTAAILDEWGQRVDSTIGKLIAHLQHLDRDDAVALIIQCAPLYVYNRDWMRESDTIKQTSPIPEVIDSPMLDPCGSPDRSNSATKFNFSDADVKDTTPVQQSSHSNLVDSLPNILSDMHVNEVEDSQQTMHDLFSIGTNGDHN